MAFLPTAPYSGSSELTASNGLEVEDAGLWLFSQAGYNDGATFGLSLGAPYVKGYYENGADTRDTGYMYGASPGSIPPPKSQVRSGGMLKLKAKDWSIAGIGNELTSYTDPVTQVTYGPDRCCITVSGHWQVIRQQNTNSFNSFNITYQALTSTDQGDRIMDPNLLTLIEPRNTTFVIQGSSVPGGEKNTFGEHEFFCRCTETCWSTNSNHEFQSNTIIRPTWVYTYTKNWWV